MTTEMSDETRERLRQEGMLTEDDAPLGALLATLVMAFFICAVSLIAWPFVALYDLTRRVRGALRGSRR